MLPALSQADTVTWVSIALKSLAYAATLSAVGSVLVLAFLRNLDARGRTSLRWTAALSALAAALLTALRLPLQASFLMGGSWEGATDPMILGMVVDSPLGTSVAVRLIGLALILGVLWRGRAAIGLAILGALLASASFALRGHALGEPRMILGPLITFHILCLAFWVGAFAPLARAVRTGPAAEAGALSHEFGGHALWAVGLLFITGGLTLVLLGAATPSALSSPYGQMFTIKLILFAGVLALAAVNKMTLTPALMAAAPGAGTRLRRSIGMEAGLVAAILIVTAAFTTVSSPSSGIEAEQATLNSRAPAQAHQTPGGSS